MPIIDAKDVPVKYRGLWERRGASRKAAMRVMCLQCMGWSTKEVDRCQDEGCPLWAWRWVGSGAQDEERPAQG